MQLTSETLLVFNDLLWLEAARLSERIIRIEHKVIQHGYGAPNHERHGHNYADDDRHNLPLAQIAHQHPR
jgi:hypothetical protein